MLIRENIQDWCKYNNETTIEGLGAINLPNLPDGIQTLDPFAGNEQLANNTTDNTVIDDNDSLFDGFDTEELPEELGGTARSPLESSSSLDTIVDGFNTTLSNTDNIPASGESEIINNSDNSIVQNNSNTIQAPTAFKLQEKIEEARNLSQSKDWTRVIDLLSPEFASVRNKDVGMILIDAWLGSDKPDMALEIIKALDIDPEMMSEDVKDVIYRTADALENHKNYSEALKLFDLICNVDINYKDAFDRSDALYVKIKG